MTEASYAAPPVWLDIYGHCVEIRSSCASALNGISEDFAFFRSQGGSGSRIVDLVEQAPPYEQLPPLTANVYTPRNVSYRDGNRTYVDYSGRALGVHHRDTGNFTIYSENADLLYEGAYLFLLSQCGEAFDARRLHRVHALGVSIRGRAALALLPMGGGKSTLGWQLLNYPGVELLSDDSPLIDAEGKVHAFPLRLGLLPGSDAIVSERHLRRINRMEFGPKLLVNYSYFADRVRPSAEPYLLLLGKRSLSRSCSIEPAGSAAALRPCGRC